MIMILHTYGVFTTRVFVTVTYIVTIGLYTIRSLLLPISPQHTLPTLPACLACPYNVLRCTEPCQRHPFPLSKPGHANEAVVRLTILGLV